MEALQHDNDLLRTYVKTLEKENEAKNQERDTLYRQIDQLMIENQELRRKVGSQTNATLQVNTSINSNTEEQLKKSHLYNHKLANELSIEITKVNKLKQELQTKDSEIVRISQEKNRLVLEIESLKSKATQNGTNSTQLTLLENQIRIYKEKVSQISIFENKLNLSIRKIDQLEKQNHELRTRKDSTIDLSTFNSQRLNFQTTIRQLNGKVQNLQSTNKFLQNERDLLHKKNTQIERQLSLSRTSLLQLKRTEEHRRSHDVDIEVKDKQMFALQQMISSLKQNRKFLENTIRQKEDIISLKQNELYSLKHKPDLSHERQKLIRQNHINISLLEQAQKQISFLKQTNKELNANVHLLQHELTNKKYSVKQNDVEEHENLRVVVDRLKNQLDELKYNSQIYQPTPVIETYECRQCHPPITPLYSPSHVHQTKKHYRHQPTHHHQPSHHHPKISPHHLQRSSHRLQKSQVGHEKSRTTINKAKWQTLQRKITDLRSENDYLKKSLFD